MNAAQTDAFEEGTGGFITAPEMLFTVQAIGTTVVFLFIAWLCYRAYIDYGSEQIDSKGMIIVWFRSLFIMMVLLYLLTQ